MTKNQKKTAQKTTGSTQAKLSAAGAKGGRNGQRGASSKSRGQR